MRVGKDDCGIGCGREAWEFSHDQTASWQLYPTLCGLIDMATPLPHARCAPASLSAQDLSPFPRIARRSSGDRSAKKGSEKASPALALIRKQFGMGEARGHRARGSTAAATAQAPASGSHRAQAILTNRLAAQTESKRSSCGGDRHDCCFEMQIDIASSTTHFLQGIIVDGVFALLIYKAA